MGTNRVDRPGSAWGAMAITSILYLPMAALAMGPYLLADPGILLEALPEGGFRTFLESALDGRTGPYQAHLAAMVFHTVTGAMLMGLGPYLLWSRPRRRTTAHVFAGRLYMATVMASMTGALIFLANEPLEAAFTGPVFALGLWAMLVGTVASAILGWVAALRHQIRLHVLWVCLNYGFVMSAPLLRLEWGLFGVAGVGDRLEEVSPQAAIHVVALSTTAAVVAGVHLADHIRPRAPRVHTPTTVSASPYAVTARAALAVAAIGLAALAWFVKRYLDHAADATTNIAWFIVPMAATVGVTLLLGRRAARTGRVELAEEHLILVCWLALAPVIGLVVAAASRVVFDLTAPVADATGLTLCGGLAVFFAVQTLHLRAEMTRWLRQAATVPSVSRSRQTTPAS